MHNCFCNMSPSPYTVSIAFKDLPLHSNCEKNWTTLKKIDTGKRLTTNAAHELHQTILCLMKEFYKKQPVLKMLCWPPLRHKQPKRPSCSCQCVRTAHRCVGEWVQRGQKEKHKVCTRLSMTPLVSRQQFRVNRNARNSERGRTYGSVCQNIWHDHEHSLQGQPSTPPSRRQGTSHVWMHRSLPF